MSDEEAGDIFLLFTNELPENNSPTFPPAIERVH